MIVTFLKTTFFSFKVMSHCCYSNALASFGGGDVVLLYVVLVV